MPPLLNPVVARVFGFSAFKKAFTLAEVIITLSILGIVAALIIPSTINNARNREFVTRAKKTYAALEQATEIWMIEEGCIGNIYGCISQINPNNSPHGFDGIARNLNIVASTSYKQKNVDGKDVALQDLQEVDWLPDTTTQFDGTKQQNPWEGVSKNGGGGTAAYIGYYLLKDGTTLSLQFPDWNGKSAFGYFDVNGKKGPNKIGVDVYPVGWGIHFENDAQREANERIYGSYATGINPFYVEDNVGAKGLCIVRNGNECTSDIKNNPLAYLLKHNKVPNK